MTSKRQIFSRYITFVLGISLSIVGQASAQQQTQRSEEFRAFWADAFHSGFKNASQVDSMVSRAVQGNYNAIVAEVLAYKDNAGGGHGAYWDSALVPMATDISSGFDPLAYLCQQAHAQGIEVHAWLVTYRVSTSWPPSGNSTLANHPEWIMVPLDDMGFGPTPMENKYFLDPGSPDVQQYLVEIVQEIVENYPVDGINWDYIRYTQTDAGYPADTSYSKSSLARFRDITGYSGTPSSSNTAWSDFRRRSIDELIRRCSAEIPSITSNPRQPVCMSGDLFASGDAPASFTSSSAYALFQNWKHWMEMGWLDAGMMMNYKRDHCSSHAIWYRNWIDAAVAWRADRHMYCGQANYLNSMSNSVSQLDYVYSAGAQGSVNYSYAVTKASNTICDSSQESSTDWSWYTYVSDNFFTTPADVPALPWRDPAIATKGSLWGRITDPDTGDPLDDATVTVNGLDPVQTDGNGYYVVTLIPATSAGTSYLVTAYKTGIIDQTSAATVFSGDIARLDFPGAVPPPPCDMDNNGVLNDTDLLQLVFCTAGPDVIFPSSSFCLAGDIDDDLDVDLFDFSQCQPAFVQWPPAE